MNPKNELEKQVLLAARDQGVSSVLFRNAVSRKMGLNSTDSDCLSFLSINGTATPTELARYTGLTTGSTTAMLDRLERDGFITRKPNLKDRRGVLVAASPRYAKAVGPLVSGVQKMHSELLARYTAEELKVIADFLARFADNVQKQTNIINEL